MTARAVVLSAALALSACATSRPQAPRVVPTASVPRCGFEAPYLPDPCRMEVAPGEWLVISNPNPKETKRHGWLWWLLVAGLL